MFSIAAINDTDLAAQWEPLAPTKEAQEFHLSQTYHEGLLKLQDKDYLKARELLEVVLRDPLISGAQVEVSASDGHLLQLKFLTLKNLATVFIEQGSACYESALHCYLQAVEIDAKDSVVWNQLGTLSCLMGLLSTSRWAFEQGLFCSPNNWNCMEKLLEVLIAIKDEVACLSVSDLILTHWPSHSRALHVKKTIEDAEPIPFSPRGIDKLEPKHVRLKFPDKRKSTDDKLVEETTSKRRNQNIELYLAGATWIALADSILGILHPPGDIVSEWRIVNEHDGTLKDEVASRHPNDASDAWTNGSSKGYQTSENFGRYTDIKIIVRFSPSAEFVRDSLDGLGVSLVGENTSLSDYGFGKTSAMKEKECGTDEEHHHERRSTRLERIRSRKHGKDEFDFASSKDLGKIVFEFLEPFIVNRFWPKDKNNSGSSHGPCPDVPAYSSVLEHNDVVKFINGTSQNCGAYQMGHMLLEEIARKNLPWQPSFIKILDLEKLTRQWGHDRSPLCSLFIGELYYDCASYSANDCKFPELLSQASYHLCKVIELAALDSTIDLASDSSISKEADDPNRNIMLSDYLAETKNAPSSNGTQNPILGLADSARGGSFFQTSLLSNDISFWVRFFWLNGCLSLSSGSKAKAIQEFSICLSILRSCRQLNDSDGFILRPHCRLMRLLTGDKLLHQINLLKVDTLIVDNIGEMVGKGMHKECISLLAPLLLSAEDVYLDLVSGDFKEGLASVELMALDVLVSASEKTEPMEIEVYMSSHRRKLQILTVAAGMVNSSASQNAVNKNIEGKFTSSSDSGFEQVSENQWYNKVVEEVKEISRSTSRVKNVIDQSDTYDGFRALLCITVGIQSLLLVIMSHAVRTILSQKLSGSETGVQPNQLESQCLVDAAIAFCKLQHLDPSIPVKTQVELIVALHDLLAEYGLCCAGKDSKGEEGIFLKLAIKHLLALDVKMKSTSHSRNRRMELKQTDGSYSVDEPELTILTESKLSSKLDLGTFEKEDLEILQKDATEESTPEIPAREAHDHDAAETGKDAANAMPQSCREQNESCDVADFGNLMVDTESEKVELGIDNALDQSFFCLYGLNIKSDSSTEDDLATHRNTNRGDYQTREQCADVFQYILPYVRAFSRAGIVKLRRVLRAIRKHFPQPPDNMLAENWIEKFLDRPDLCEDKIEEVVGSVGNQDALLNILLSNGDSETCNSLSIMGSEPYSEVYANLYYFIAQAEEISATDKFAGFVLKKEGEEFVEQNANLFKYDLLYNPLRFESWQKLANIYDEEVDLLLNDGSKHINIVDWRKNAILPQRVENGRRRSRRCLLMSLALAKTPQQSQIHELLALVYYDSLQNVVPFYDQQSIIPSKDATWMTFCQKSMKHFEKAFALKPEWLHAFYLGKLCEKMGYPCNRALSYYEQAVSLNPSAVDPVYRMHASRLKLLYTHGKQNLDMLRVVASYSFNQSTKQAVLNMFSKPSSDLPHVFKDVNDVSGLDDSVNERKEPIQPHQLDEAWQLLYNDCLSGLETCVEGELKHFHKARYMLAQGLYKRSENGDLEKAKDELSFCFRSSRSSFTINMWEIDGLVKKGKRKSIGLGGNRRSLEVSLPESSRKFITCIRKYILLYLNLLEKTGDLCTLDRAYVHLRSDKRFSLCLGDITPVAFGRYIKVLISSIRASEAVGSTTTNAVEHLLERMFNNLVDHVNLLMHLSSLPDLHCPELSENSLYSYIHQYIDYLETDVQLDALDGVNEKIRKRFKNPKLSSGNCAKMCKHASLAWSRSIIIKLALITPVSDSGNLRDHVSGTYAMGGLENGTLLFVDIQPDELCKSLLEGSSHAKILETEWFRALSRIKNVHIKQASEQNMEVAITLLRSAYNFYRDCSSGTYLSGINIFTVLSSQVMVEGVYPPGKSGTDILDLSIPRKLLLWAYTLVHGYYSNISVVIKYCEENAKSRMKRGTAAAVLPHVNIPSCIVPTGGGRERTEPEECVEVDVNLSVPRCLNIHTASTETHSSNFSALHFQQCSAIRASNINEGESIGDNESIR